LIRRIDRASGTEPEAARGTGGSEAAVLMIKAVVMERMGWWMEAAKQASRPNFQSLSIARLSGFTLKRQALKAEHISSRG
jgi:hypothetical protein